MCLPAFQYSSQSLCFLPWCCASKRSGPAAHFLLTDTQTHTQRVPPSLPTQEPLPSWPCSQGNTHQLHLGTQPFQDPVGSLRLLLQVGKGRGRKKKSYLCHSVTSSSSLFQLSLLLKPLLKPPQSHHKSHPCLRGAAKAQLSLWTCSKIPWVKKGSATRLIMTLEQLSCAQGMTQSPDPSGCQAGGLCPVPLHGCPARRRRRRRMRAGKPARTQR